MPKSGIIRAGRLLELEAVAAVAHRCSFRAAAHDLGMSTTALSRTISAVEERLGLQLFTRTTRSVALTAAGETFVGRVSPALREIAGAIEDIGDQRKAPRGTIRINSSAGAARRIIEPMTHFLSRYPEISVELTTESRLIDIVAEGFDAGIRQAGAVPSGMASVRITEPMTFIVVASPTYLAGRSPPTRPSDLHQHRCVRIRLSSGKIYPWEFRHPSLGEEHVDVAGALTLDDPELMRRAALAGAGLAYVERSRVTQDIASGSLVGLLEDWGLEEEPLHLYHPSRHPSGALRALIEALTAHQS